MPMIAQELDGSAAETPTPHNIARFADTTQRDAAFFDVEASPPVIMSDADEADNTLKANAEDLSPTPRKSNTSSSVAASRPLSMVSAASVTSSRTSMDDQLLHPRTASGNGSLKLKRHSMYESPGSPQTPARRPLSAALDDMVCPLLRIPRLIRY